MWKVFASQHLEALMHGNNSCMLSTVFRWRINGSNRAAEQWRFKIMSHVCSISRTWDTCVVRNIFQSTSQLACVFDRISSLAAGLGFFFCSFAEHQSRTVQTRQMRALKWLLSELFGWNQSWRNVTLEFCLGNSQKINSASQPQDKQLLLSTQTLHRKTFFSSGKNVSACRKEPVEQLEPKPKVVTWSRFSNKIILRTHKLKL